MATASVKSGKTEKSGLVTFFQGVGCFLIGSLCLIAIFLACGYAFVWPMISQIRQSESLPEFDGPSVQDFWTFQEKNLAKKNAEEGSLEAGEWNLTAGEFNAWLSSVRIPPTNWFNLARLRHKRLNGKVQYFMLGSGLFQKKLTISFRIEKNGSGAKPVDFAINSYKVNNDDFVYKYCAKMLSDMANSDQTGLLNSILTGKLTPYE